MNLDQLDPHQHTTSRPDNSEYETVGTDPATPCNIPYTQELAGGDYTRVTENQDIPLGGRAYWWRN